MTNMNPLDSKMRLALSKSDGISHLGHEFMGQQGVRHQTGVDAATSQLLHNIYDHCTTTNFQSSGCKHLHMAIVSIPSELHQA